MKLGNNPKFTLEVIQSNEQISEPDISELVKIFSQNETSKLFKKQASVDTITSYVNWSINSTKDGKLRLVIVRDLKNIIVAGVELQSSSEKVVTIGFWKNRSSEIRMHNVLPEVLSYAKRLNFSIADAYTDPTNTNAIKLLERLSFTNHGFVDGKTKRLVKFTRVI